MRYLSESGSRIMCHSGYACALPARLAAPVSSLRPSQRGDVGRRARDCVFGVREPGGRRAAPGVSQGGWRRAPAGARVAFVTNPFYRAEVEASPGLTFAGVGSAEAHARLLADSDARRDKRALVRHWLSHLDEHRETLLRLARARRHRRRSRRTPSRPRRPVPRGDARAPPRGEEDRRGEDRGNPRDEPRDEPRDRPLPRRASPRVFHCGPLPRDASRRRRAPPAVRRRPGRALARPALAREPDPPTQRPRRGRGVSTAARRAQTPTGSSPASRVYNRWFLCRRALALWPEWFGPPRADWPSGVSIVGFPSLSRDRDFGPGPLPIDVEAFLARAPPPWVFVAVGEPSGRVPFLRRRRRRRRGARPTAVPPPPRFFSPATPSASRPRSPPNRRTSESRTSTTRISARSFRGARASSITEASARARRRRRRARDRSSSPRRSINSITPVDF